MSCYKYWGKIKDISNRLSALGDCNIYESLVMDKLNIEDIIDILDEVEIITHDETIDFNSAKHILDDERMNEALKLIRNFYIYVGARLERDNAFKILESENPKETLNSFHFYERYIGLINNESKLTKFNEDKTLVFVGSGPLPITLLMFNEVFGCKCIGIEINEEVANLSKKVLKRLDLDNDIKIIVGDETAIADLEYDILMIAAFAEPKDKVFSNVWKLVDEKTPIIYRTYTGMKSILYSPVKDEDLEGFKKEVMILPTGTTNNTSVLISKINKT